MTVPVFRDRVEEGTATTGTGTITLTGATTGGVSFNSAVPSGSLVEVGIDDLAGSWEISRGTFTAPDQLTREVVLSSSNGGALVDFAAGTKVVYLTVSSATYSNLSAPPFDVSVYVPSTMTANHVLLRVPLARPVTFTANFGGSYANATVAPAGNVSIAVQRSDANVGTLNFTAGNVTGVFATSGGNAVTYNAGAVLSLVAPASADANLSGLGVVLAGSRAAF